MKGSQIIIEVLKEENVEVIFGYPGGTILNVYDAYYQYGGNIKHYLTAHEQGAVHAADGYARATGKVGVCFSTSGPGATNMVTGLATAFMDSIPLVAITCNVQSNLLGKDSFQEVDIAGITMPITKHNYIVDNVNELADTIRNAFYIAKSGRQGPVLIDIPKNITAEEAEYTIKKSREYLPNKVINETEINNALKTIHQSKRIFVVSGGGVISSGAEQELYQMVKMLKAPVANTLMGLGSYPGDDENFTGMVGMHGTKASNLGISSSDMLIAVGVRFSDRVICNSTSIPSQIKVLHIDIDDAEINKNLDVDIEIVGDAKQVLQKLLCKLKERQDRSFLDEIIGIKNTEQRMDTETMPINPQFVMETICEKTKGRAIITTEVGQNQMWAASYFKYTQPRTFISSGGLGTMGFGTGASMGCAIGVKDKRVVAIAGDGSFRMNCNELSTMKFYNIPVIIVILNNQTLGMVRQWQTMFYSGRYSETNLNRGPNFKKLAEAYDVDGYTVATKKEFDAAFETALAKNEPAVIDVHIDKDLSVFPMVSPGRPIDEIICEAYKTKYD